MSDNVGWEHEASGTAAPGRGGPAGEEPPPGRPGQDASWLRRKARRIKRLCPLRGASLKTFRLAVRVAAMPSMVTEMKLLAESPARSGCGLVDADLVGEVAGRQLAPLPRVQQQ